MKPDSNLSDPWEKLAAARRRSMAAYAPEMDVTAPFGFAQRIASRAMSRHRHEGLGWWTRWMLRAALSSGVIVGVLTFVQPQDNGTAPLLAAPSIEVPSLASP